MKTKLHLSIILISILVLSLISAGCATKYGSNNYNIETTQVKVEYTSTTHICPEPTYPEFLLLEPDQSIDSDWNSYVLLYNVVAYENYIDQLIATNRCYKKRTEEQKKVEKDAGLTDN